MMIIIIFLAIFTSKAITTIIVDKSYSDNDQFLQLSSEEYMINQSVANATFYFQPQQSDIGKYIEIELIFQFPQNGEVNMQFSVTKNNLAALNNQGLLASYQDLNGFYLQKSYQFIQIPAYSYSAMDKFFLTANSIDSQKYQYILRISQSSYSQCPGMCDESNGECQSASGLCNCQPDKIDLDCSLNAQQITFANEQTYSFPGGKFYFYFQMETKIDSAAFTFDLFNDEDVSVYFLFENFTIGAPSQFYNDFTFQCTEKTKKQYLFNFDQLTFNPDLQRYERLLVAVHSQQPITFKTLINVPPGNAQSQQSSPMYIYFLIGLGILLILIWIIIVIIRCKRKSTQVRDINSQYQLNSSPNRRKLRQSQYQHAIDEYMPKIFFKTATHILNETLPSDFSCAMCLVQYEDSSVCRITPCKHIFHSNCICEWLSLHQNCPLCRNDLDEKSLELLKYEAQGFFQQIVRLKRKRHEAKISNIVQENGQSGVRLTLEQI